MNYFSLSAHTLGKKLSGLAAIMWDKRETYDGIVLMDDHTTKYDYKGSKLQMLRSFIVEVCSIKYKYCICDSQLLLKQGL